MAYALGVDLGTTFTAAGVCRDGRVEIVTLGDRSAVVPSVILLREDETILTGAAADRRAVTEPGRVAREFKRRVGDPTPIILGGTPYSAEALMAKMLRWTVDAAAEREGGPPDAVAVSHPANWGPYKKDLLGEALRLADLAGVATITEPEAAAIYYASAERVPLGSVVAVYDLGGGTFDAAVLRKTETGFEILGQPEGIERLGGIDFDEAVFAHVRRALGGALEDLDPSDPAALAAVARLRRDCIEAKEALSGDTDTSIPVLLPNVQTEVRITRGELENMVRPAIAETIDAFRRALRSASVEPADVSAVLLVGGSSRIPIVAQMVSAAIGRPVAVDAHPKHAVAMGAALSAAGSLQGATMAEVPPEGAAVAAMPSVVAPAQDAPLPASTLSEAPAPTHEPAPVRPPEGRSLLAKLGSLVVALALVAGAVAVFALKQHKTGSKASQTPTGTVSPSRSVAPGGGGSALTWQRAPSQPAVFGGPGDQLLRSVTTGGPGFVAVGWDGVGDSVDAAVWTSPDGTSWSRTAGGRSVFGGAGSQTMNWVTSGGPGFVAVGSDNSSGSYDGAVWSSADGTSWTRIHSPALGGRGDQTINFVVATPRGLMAVGYADSSTSLDAAVWLSADGSKWERVADSPALGGKGAQRMRCVVASGGRFIATGSDESNGNSDAAAWTSVDGRTWKRTAVPASVFGGRDDQSIARVNAGGPGFVAVGTDKSSGTSNAAVWTSSNGAAWRRVPDPASALGGPGEQGMEFVLKTQAGLIAVGSDGPRAAVWVSPNGSSWTKTQAGDVFGGSGDQVMKAVAASSSLIVGVGWGGSDAVVWTAQLKS